MEAVALSLLISLQQPWLKFSACEGAVDTTLTRALIDVEGALATETDVDVSCAGPAKVTVAVPRVKRELDLGTVPSSLRSQFLALAILGAVADLRILNEANAPRFQNKQTLLVTGVIALTSIVFGTFVTLTGMGLVLASNGGPPSLAQAGVAFIASGGSIMGLSGIPFGFWLYERSLPQPR